MVQQSTSGCPLAGSCMCTLYTPVYPVSLPMGCTTGCVVTHAATCCRVRRHATPCDGVRRCTSSPPILPPPRCCDLAPSSCFVFLFGLRSSSSRSSSFFSGQGRKLCGSCAHPTATWPSALGSPSIMYPTTTHTLPYQQSLPRMACAAWVVLVHNSPLLPHGLLWHTLTISCRPALQTTFAPIHMNILN